MKHKKPFAHLEEITINNSSQWVLVRGKNVDAPLLIHVQAGPGFPMISEASEMEKKLHLEDDFLVAYWDQRGCGKSFSKDLLPETMTLTQMADDVIACTSHLLKKYNKDKAIIVGYSIGATASLVAAAKDGRFFSALFVAGIDVDIPYADQYCLDFAMDKAVAKNDKKLVQKINDLKSQPVVDAKKFQERAKILTNLGGIKADSNYNSLALNTVKNILFSRFYGIVGLVKTMKGMEFCQNAFLPEMSSLNLFQIVTSVSVPVHFIQGSLDAVAPPARGRDFYEQLKAVNKSFTVFEKSAHTPHYEEPEKFANLIRSTVHK
ncbi:MAG: alpha/beta hydrolase [Bacteroidota bacterium]|nr:alpha/beta hydrolase [Bacteroidota bacterium]